jgi:hypothetical protein
MTNINDIVAMIGNMEVGKLETFERDETKEYPKCIELPSIEAVVYIPTEACSFTITCSRAVMDPNAGRDLLKFLDEPMDPLDKSL